MKYIKLQQDFIKDLDNDDIHNSSCRCLVTKEYQESIGIGNEYAVYFVPKSKLYVDTSKTIREPIDIIKFIPEYRESYKVKKRGEFRESKKYGRKKMFECFESASGHAWLDTKFTKYFDEDAVYYVSSEASPVKVEENGQLAGIVMPVRLEK